MTVRNVTRPRRWLVLNPNTSAAITRGLVAAIGRQAPADVEIAGATARFGAPLIATRESFAVAAEAALDLVRDGGVGWDAILLGCFGDPGLAALRRACAAPVIGFAEASFRAAKTPFAVLTCGKGWVSILSEQIAALPGLPPCRGIWALDVPGSAVAAEPARHAGALDALAAEAVAAGARTVILGGAVLAGTAARLRTPVPFIDCIDAAVGAAAAR